MSVNGDAARRDMWAGRIERCLASGMAIGEWCSLNKVNKSSMYRWLAVFRDEDPGRFGGKNSETSEWVKVTRQGIAEAKAIVPAAGAADPAEEAPASWSPSAASPIRALVGRVELAIPAGSAESDIAAAMRAAASL